MMLQQETPDDYVVATNEMHTVREFVEKSFSISGMNIIWEGEGDKEVGKNAKTGEIIVAVDPKFYRPTEVEQLLGNPEKARKNLGWEPRVKFEELVKIMTLADLELFGVKVT